MVVVPSGYEVGELANKHFFASLCVRHNLVSARFVREATPLTDRDHPKISHIRARKEFGMNYDEKARYIRPSPMILLGTRTKLCQI